MHPTKNSRILSEGEESSLEFEVRVQYCASCGSIMHSVSGGWRCQSCNGKPESVTRYYGDFPRCYGNISNDVWPKDDGTFSAEVDRISNNGNGIIELQGAHVNLGQMSKDMVGEEVIVEVVGGAPVRVITDEKEPIEIDHQPSDSASDPTIQSEDGELTEPHDPSGDSVRHHTTHTSTHAWSGPSRDKEIPSPGKETKGEIHRVSELGNGIIQFKNGYLNLGEIPEEMVGEVVHAKVIEGWSARILPENDCLEDLSSNEADSAPQTEPYHDAAVEETEDEPDNDGGSAAKNDSTRSIDELRQRANDSAVEEVPENATIRAQEKPEYNRSVAVKRYVKARADGTCEGCDRSAPFTSITGEPYLHAHHVHELSDGGSDTPDTVIALCPNCHYRVHHGQDGDEFNQTLIDTLREIEDVG